MSMQNELEKLGLSDHEAAVYLALIDIGQTGAGEIIKKTGLHRNIVYETLDKLILKKLAAKVTVKNVAQYQPSDPKRIVTNIKANLDLAKMVIPDLAKRADIKHDIVVYEGLEGFRTYNFSVISKIKKSGVQHILGGASTWFDLMGETYRRYDKLRRQKRIIWKSIVYDQVLRDEKAAFSQVRTIPRQLSTPANMHIWEDVVALQMMVEPYTVIEIKNAALAEAYMNYFNLLWELGK